LVRASLLWFKEAQIRGSGVTPRIKCAIYTRKSSEEGLEQSFNSLDAQREACQAYIRSQKHEGWVSLTTKYDDGGFTGGNINRPALKKLMGDIAEGKVNTVVVYKVDRLTRSLADFAKIIEQFDSKGVTFVSVTQQFNTTTSMGRLTLNVLLSFAQFEREVTGERIRDKIAASKAKDMWMGGRVPLGYDLRERRLYINSAEADSVREIFSQYLRLRTVPALMLYLRQKGIRSKVRIGAGGKRLGEQHCSRGALYQLLRNHLYVGEIEHKGSIYSGEHAAIIDRELWNQVQELLDQNRQGSKSRSRNASGCMLTGLLFSGSGVRYIPTYTQKGGRRYHYYTSQSVIKGDKEEGSIGRLPAPALESAVADRMRSFFQSPAEVLDALKRTDLTDLDYQKLLKHAKQRSSDWPSHSERIDLIRAVLQRVIVQENSIEIQIGLDSLLQVLSGILPAGGSKTANVQTVSLKASFRHISQGKALKLVIGNDRTESTASREAIARAIARSRSWYEQIVQGRASGLVDLARQYGLTHRYVKSIFPLAFLGPESVEFLLNSRERQSQTLDSLMGRVPMHWGEQRALLRGE
jgi:site-specific DNA recombinase